MVAIDSSSSNNRRSISMSPSSSSSNNASTILLKNRICIRNVILSVQWTCIGSVLVWLALYTTTPTNKFAITTSTTTINNSKRITTTTSASNDILTVGTNDNKAPSMNLRGGGNRNDSKVVKNNKSSNNQCRFYLAESAIPFSGLGLFTTIDISKGQEAQSMPDICIYVADTPPEDTAFETHSWARDVFLGQFEGRNPRAACEGFATLFNSMPEGKRNVRTSSLVSIKYQTNGGLSRYKHPGSGAITHYYGISSKAERNIVAGSELTINYGDWEYERGKEYIAPIRSVDWIRQHGMCIDNIEIHPATDPTMGRGAFAKRFLSKGSILAPAPIQAYKSRKEFAQRTPEALFINYCFEIPLTTGGRSANISNENEDSILFFPYGPGVNLINHGNASIANVKVEWSNHYMSHTNWLQLPIDQFWQMMYPGAIIMDIIALRDIKPGEELYMDYGIEWEMAWMEHVKNWKPPPSTHDYAYVEDLLRDHTSNPFRTVEEQKSNPYPSNVHTVCYTSNWKRDDYTTMKWKKPKDPWFAEGLVYCNILSRSDNIVSETISDKGSEPINHYVYNVSLNYDYLDPDAKEKLMYIDTDVPHSAISFVDKPYKSDLHLRKAFRHPIGLPKSLFPMHWLLSTDK